MLVRGIIDRIYVNDKQARKGPVRITSVWIEDRHDGVHAVGMEPTYYLCEFVDSAKEVWSATVTEDFQIGDRVMVYSPDPVTAVASGPNASVDRTYIKVRGRELALSSLDTARDFANDTEGAN